MVVSINIFLPSRFGRRLPAAVAPEESRGVTVTRLTSCFTWAWLSCHEESGWKKNIKVKKIFVGEEEMLQ